MQKKSPTVPIIITVLLVIAVCCLLILLVVLFGGAAIFSMSDTGQIGEVAMSTPIPRTPQVIEQFITDTPVANDPGEITPPETPEPIVTVSPGSALETLLTLQQEIVPINDPIDLGERLAGKIDIPETMPDPNAPYSVGDTQNFWVTNVDSNENFQITATLRYLGDNVYIWIQNGVSYDHRDLTDLGDTFDNEIYPTNREFFGNEWSPGVDGDPHIYIVYAGGLGSSLLGYYSSADQLHPDAHEYSNAHEMFLINSDNLYLWESDTYSTLAHEFQHMIHWYTDENEETWLNEGFSMLAELINGFGSVGHEYNYIANPDLTLTDWGTVDGNNSPHYGAAMLFTTYFLDRFGEDATKAVVAHDKNGMESISLVLEDLDIRDPSTNALVTADDVFADWVVTNFLGDPNVADGRYHYSIYPDAPIANAGNSFPVCPTNLSDFTVSQYGVDYIEISCQGDFTLTFSGSTTSTILPTSPYSGETFFWSNMGDHSNMSLEQRFDLTNVNGPVELTFQTWYDLEEDYDYVFVSASTDGENWQILNTTSCTTDNPSGNSYGCGLNGKSNGWQQESVNLASFAGQEVTLRFDYVTDAAVNGVGMVIDDVQIEAINYFTDFETDTGGWHPQGFVRIQNVLPQKFNISMITFGNEINVVPLVLDENNQASINISIGDDVESIVLAISGITPYTRQKADYQLQID